MLQATPVTWFLVIFGFTTLAPLLLAQLLAVTNPNSRQARDLLIARGEDWRDQTHFRSAIGMAWADWLLLVPLAVAGSIGVILGHAWGYLLWAGAGSITLYINIVLWFMERQYVYPKRGALVYYTYYWGFFMLWGALALVYAALRLGGFDI